MINYCKIYDCKTLWSTAEFSPVIVWEGSKEQITYFKSDIMIWSNISDALWYWNNDALIIIILCPLIHEGVAQCGCFCCSTSLKEKENTSRRVNTRWNAMHVYIELLICVYCTCLCLQQWGSHLKQAVEHVHGALRQGSSLGDLPQERVVLALSLSLIKGVCERTPGFLRDLFHIWEQQQHHRRWPHLTTPSTHLND